MKQIGNDVRGVGKKQQPGNDEKNQSLFAGETFDYDNGTYQPRNKRQKQIPIQKQKHGRVGGDESGD